jgi:uncharacterized protein (DUF58 family)
VITAASRRLLDRYALASRALSRSSGERLAREAGQSVEFHDYRPYQPGDELRAVDWRVYARTQRLMTRLFQAERTMDVHVVLDTSMSMSVGGKLEYGRTVAQLLAYVAHRDSRAQVHTFHGEVGAAGQGRAGLASAWSMLEAATTRAEGTPPVAALRRFALTLPRVRGAGLALIISDLFDPEPLRPALLALRARGLDAAFVQVVADDDLDPVPGRLELVDVESRARLLAGPEEVRAYREAVQAFVRRTHAATRQAGFPHVLLRVDPQKQGLMMEREAFAALRRSRLLIPR